MTFWDFAYLAMALWAGVRFFTTGDPAWLTAALAWLLLADVRERRR